eukprot:m51a1_g1521 hypothetical protein (653) ;mRNA; r:438258-440733
MSAWTEEALLSTGPLWDAGRAFAFLGDPLLGSLHRDIDDDPAFWSLDPAVLFQHRPSKRPRHDESAAVEAVRKLRNSSEVARRLLGRALDTAELLRWRRLLCSPSVPGPLSRADLDRLHSSLAVPLAAPPAPPDPDLDALLRQRALERAASERPPAAAAAAAAQATAAPAVASAASAASEHARKSNRRPRAQRSDGFVYGEGSDNAPADADSSAADDEEGEDDDDDDDDLDDDDAQRPRARRERRRPSASEARRPQLLADEAPWRTDASGRYFEPGKSMLDGVLELAGWGERQQGPCCSFCQREAIEVAVPRAVFASLAPAFPAAAKYTRPFTAAYIAANAPSFLCPSVVGLSPAEMAWLHGADVVERAMFALAQQHSHSSGSGTAAVPRIEQLAVPSLAATCYTAKARGSGLCRRHASEPTPHPSPSAQALCRPPALYCCDQSFVRARERLAGCARVVADACERPGARPLDDERYYGAVPLAAQRYQSRGAPQAPLLLSRGLVVAGRRAAGAAVDAVDARASALVETLARLERESRTPVLVALGAPAGACAALVEGALRGCRVAYERASTAAGSLSSVYAAVAALERRQRGRQRGCRVLLVDAAEEGAEAPVVAVRPCCRAAVFVGGCSCDGGVYEALCVAGSPQYLVTCV